jgi:vitamin K-dependent gamma-carboxylase
MTATEWGRKLQRALSAPVDAASVEVFRLLFGLAMLVAVLRFFVHGWIAEYFLEPRHFFSYYGFEWVRPWPGVGMYLHFAAMGVLATLIATGLFHRLSTLLFTLLFAYAHLIDKTNYLNHYYLLICLGFLLACLPLGRTFSLAPRATQPGSTHLPAWMLYALRAQFALVYVFGGIAKLKGDWLLDAQPLRIWLAANSDFPVLGPWLGQVWVAHTASIAGALYDLSIVPLLLWRRTRWPAYAAVVLFHLITARLFQLGMFPWIMVLGSLLFLPPDWPRALLAKLRGRSVAVLVAPAISPTTTRRTLLLLTAYFAFHLLMPLRHLLYPGDVCWTEQGFRFSWNVMLMEKNGSVDFRVVDPATGKRWVVAPTEYLTRYQTKMMAPQPDMVLQMSHIIADDFRARGVSAPQVFVDAYASLNGRRAARLIDPTVDLAQEADGLRPKPWILPLPPTISAPAAMALQGIRP